MAFRLILAALIAVPAHAEALPDPTRPPPQIEAPAAEPAASGPVLQAIRTVGGVRTAVISGQAVQVGGRVGDWRVTRIDEDQVMLAGAGGTQTLKLFPNVEKRRHGAETAAKSAPARAGRKDSP